MSQMFCMCLRSCALRAILYSKCCNTCALSDGHLSSMQRHINTWGLFCPQGRNSAVWELFKPSKWCTFGNKYRCLFLKAAQAVVGLWTQRITQKSLLTANDKSQNTEEESFASQDDPRPCVSAAFFLTKMNIYVQRRCNTKCTFIGSHCGENDTWSQLSRSRLWLTVTKLHLLITNTNCCLGAKIVKAASFSRCLGYVFRGLNILSMWTSWGIS